MSTEPSPSAGRRMTESTPFYMVPERLKDKLSSQIIKAAKTSLKSVATDRPETPRDGQRNQGLDPRYMESESRPVSGTRLAPLEYPRPPIREQDMEAALTLSKPPPDPTRPPRPPSSRSRPSLHQSVSAEGGALAAPPSPGMPTALMPSSGEPRIRSSRSGSLQNLEAAATHTPPATSKERRVHSEPKERSSSKDDKRGDSRSRRRPPPDPAVDNVESSHSSINREAVDYSSLQRQGSAGSQRQGSGGSQRQGSDGRRSARRESSGSRSKEDAGESKSKEAGASKGKEAGASKGKEARRSGSAAGSAVAKPSCGGRIRADATEKANGDGGRTRTTDPIEKPSSGGRIRGETIEKPSSGGRTRGDATEKPSSAGRREEESEADAQYFNECISPIIDRMTVQAKDKDPEKLITLSEKLYQSLSDGGLLGKACKRRPAMLKTVFKLLDLEAPRLLLKLARLILALRVSGNNLTNVCKLVFKVSRDEKNDGYFLEDNLLELLIDVALTADHMANAEALVYCVGALKFLSGNSTLVKHLVQRHVVEALARLLTDINNTHEELGKPNEQLGHILVQLTATLRNVADVSSTRLQFLSHQIVDELGRTMELCSHDKDLMLNIGRILSKITVHSDCCAAVSNQAGHLRAMLELLHKYMDKDDLVVRICFVLGNVTAKTDSARARVAAQPRTLDTLLALLKYYLELDIKLMNQGDAVNNGGSGSSKPSKQEDVLIKVVRVVANLSINADVGQDIATSVPCVENLISILNIKKLSSSEELVMNVLATVNNLSFYNCRNSAITKKQIHLAEALLPLFDHATPHDGLAEVTRVFGNLSRERAVRDHLSKNKVDEVLISLLDSDHRELVFTACGVLINLMADDEKRSVLKRCSGVTKLVEVLRDFGRQDWQLASMVCQTLWNYSGRITSANDCFGQHEAAQLTELLTEFVDEECALDPELNPEYDAELGEYCRDVWRTDFCPVATQLADRIDANSSKLEPI